MYEGFLVGKDKVHLSILQFADSLLFCKYDEAMLVILIQTIGLFEWCSGQKVNWEKSPLYRVNVDEATLNSTSSRLNCTSGKLPFVPRLASWWISKTTHFLQPIIDKVYLKLDRWKMYNLSRKGWLTLCNAVLENLPTYHMSKDNLSN